MIGYLKGTVAASDGQIVTLMVGGVGFEVMMPNDGETLFSIGEEAAIYTYMHVRENEIGFYGFSSALEKKLFNVLIGVSGIGPKSAMPNAQRFFATGHHYSHHHRRRKTAFLAPGDRQKNRCASHP